MSRSQAVWLQRDTAFLLNSWALLVTIGSDFHQSQALSRSYSSNWPNSLNYHTSMAIGYSPRRPDAVIGTPSVVYKKALASWINQTALDTDESVFCQWRMQKRPCGLFWGILQLTWFLARVHMSFRKEIPNNRYLIDGKRFLRVTTTYN